MIFRDASVCVVICKDCGGTIEMYTCSHPPNTMTTAPNHSTLKLYLPPHRSIAPYEGACGCGPTPEEERRFEAEEDARRRRRIARHEEEQAKLERRLAREARRE